MKTVLTKNTKPMHNELFSCLEDELFSELEIAMTSNPDLSMFDVIKYVTDKAFPNRIKYVKNMENYYTTVDPVEEWKLTNSDILKALKQYNSRV